MSTSLYQKYRPQQFKELVGQDHIRTTLLSEVKNKAVSHAYLFSGPRGIGKTTAARLLARAVNCTDLKDGEPCNECNNCKLIINQKALDLVEIDAASNTGVDHVRENIIENARVNPSMLPWKVFIIDEVHMLSTSAFNALLKTLEEPPQKTMFILATTEIHKVPSTIISRCEQFHFKRISLSAIVERLQSLSVKEQIVVDQEVLDAIGKRSEGALRDAESLLGQVMALDEKHITADLAEIVLPQSNLDEIIDLWSEVVGGKTADAIKRVNRLLDQGVILTEFTKDLIEFLRKALLYKVQDSLEPLKYLDINKEILKQVSGVADGMQPKEMAGMIEVFIEAYERSKAAVIPQLPLELAIVRLTEASDVLQNKATKTEPPADNQGKLIADKLRAPEQQPSSSEEKTESSNKPAIKQSSSLTIADVKAQWGTVLEQMKHHNHALNLTFQVAQIVSIDNGTLTLGFQHQFYQDRINDPRNSGVIHNVFTEVFNTPLQIDIVVGKEYTVGPGDEIMNNIEQPSEEEVANVWDLAASSFGTTQS